MDATRESDNSLVALKRVKKTISPQEVEMAQYLSAEPLRSDPRNHSVPILEVLPVPDDPEITLIVMPLLRPCNDPDFFTLGEAMSFLAQVFEVEPPPLCTRCPGPFTVPSGSAIYA